MATSTALRHIARICESADDARRLRLEVLEEIGRVVPFDAYVWLLTDPETSVGSSPLADVPCLSELPRLIRLKYQTEVLRWTSLAPGPASLLRVATGGDLSQSLVWRELLVRHHVGDMASSVFRDDFGCWGFLDLWRYDTSPPFDRAAAAFLGEVNRPITSALRRCAAATFGVRPSHDAARVGTLALLLSADLEVLGQTPETDEYLRLLVPPTDDRLAPVPAVAYNVAAQLLATEVGTDTARPFARAHIGHGTWLALRAARIGGSAPPSAESNIAVTIQEASAAERVDLLTRACALTPREGELLRLLASGIDTRGLASRLHLSEHTVQDHLKAIFSKTATHSRRALLALAVGA